MVHTIISVSLILGTVIGFVAYAGPYIAQPILNETKCAIQTLEVFEITDTKYLIEMKLLNSGDTTITNYDVRSSGWTISRSAELDSGDSITDEFTVNSIDEQHLEVLIFTIHDSAICSSGMYL